MAFLSLQSTEREKDVGTINNSKRVDKRKSIILLVSSQALPACPSDKYYKSKESTSSAVVWDGGRGISILWIIVELQNF
jgi:hypothetical protein